MILDQEIWMDIRRFKALHESGTTYAEIGREFGVNYRTVKKYLAADAPAGSSRSGTQPRAVTAVFEGVIRGMLKADVELKASVVHERLVSEHGFFGHYQRVKAACRELRPLVEAELDVQDESHRLRGLRRRFEVLPGAQSRVDWGHEGDLLGVGVKVYSFHMTLSFSRDPFRCYVTSMDTATWWACHRRAFEYFGGVPASIACDRTATIVRRHVAPGRAVPLQPEPAAFAGNYGFAIDVLAAFRPTGKGRVERYVEITRDQVLAGRSFATMGRADAAFLRSAPIRRSQVHRTHGEAVGARRVRSCGARSGAGGGIRGDRGPLPAGRQRLTDLAHRVAVLCAGADNPAPDCSATSPTCARPMTYGTWRGSSTSRPEWSSGGRSPTTCARP
jgi:transposase